MNLVDALIPCMHIIQTIITHACLLLSIHNNVVLTIEFASSKFYLVFIMGDYFLFGSVFIKKSN